MTMRMNRSAKAGAGAATFLLLGAALMNAITASAVEFAHPAFKRTWDRTDSLVASGQVSRLRAYAATRPKI